MGFKFSWSLRACKMRKYRRSFKCDFKKCYGPIVTDQTQWKMRFFECHHLSKYVVDHRFRVNGGRFKNSSWNIFLGDVFISLGNSIKIMTRSLLVASFKIFSFSSLKKSHFNCFLRLQHVIVDLFSHARTYTTQSHGGIYRGSRRHL